MSLPEPVFEEPWQAEAFALAVCLREAGAFTPGEWAAALGAEIAAAGPGDDGREYYGHCLAALERLVTERGMLRGDDLARRKDAWASAYRRTPHGRPVSL